MRDSDPTIPTIPRSAITGPKSPLSQNQLTGINDYPSIAAHCCCLSSYPPSPLSHLHILSFFCCNPLLSSFPFPPFLVLLFKMAASKEFSLLCLENPLLGKSSLYRGQLAAARSVPLYPSVSSGCDMHSRPYIHSTQHLAFSMTCQL